MRRPEPPPIATWMLEHCTVGDCNEGLEGDLREGYASGLSDGWYWRQVVAACAVSWSEGIRVRAPLLVFALLWSMLAPAWKIFINGIESAPVFDRFLLPLGGFWVFPAFAGWLLLNGIFLWAGIFVYFLSLSLCGRVFRGNEIGRASLLAPFVYALVFGAWFALCTLDWTSSLEPFAIEKLSTTPFGQISDLSMAADFIRLPYFVTLVCVLWTAIPLSKYRRLLPVDSPPIESFAPDDSLPSEATLDPDAARRFVGFNVGAGLVNAFIAGIVFCRLFEIHLYTFSALLARSVFHDITVVVAGVAGSWLYWKHPASRYRGRFPMPFPLFALVCASGWIWVAPMVILSEQLSPAAAMVAALGAIFLAMGLRYATSTLFASEGPDGAGGEPDDSDLFSKSLCRDRPETRGYAIAFLLYAGGCALAMRLNLAGTGLLTLCAFLFAWNQTYVPDRDHRAGCIDPQPRSRSIPQGLKPLILCSFYGTTEVVPFQNSIYATSSSSKREYRRAALRLACVVLPAILVTVWALLGGEAPGNRTNEVNPAADLGNRNSADKGARRKAEAEPYAYGRGGYESLILWPVPEKKQIVPPLPEMLPLAPGITRALIVPFSGQYWYVQPPDTVPGPTAHRAHGSPLGAEIASIDSTPLVMDAHQTLGTAVSIARCREIQVEIENRDNTMGAIALAVLLTNTASPESSTLYLGQQPILSTEAEHFFYKSEPVSETLRFPVPARAKIRRFDEITVMMLPNVEHELVGPKIAITQFRLLPR